MLKTIGLIIADLQTTPLGTQSREAREIGGVPLLRRTVERLSRAKLISGIHVLCPVAQLEGIRSLLIGVSASVHPYDGQVPPWRRLVQSARKWSLDGWRGGLGGATWFDEYTFPALAAEVLKRTGAQAVLCVPGAAPVVSPELADQLIHIADTSPEDLRIAFTTAVPGVSPVLMKAELVQQLTEQGIPPGWVLSYKPDQPTKDLIFQPCCVEIPVELRHARGRLIGDTRRAFERLEALLADHPDPDLVAVGKWLARYDRTFVQTLPVEVEIELTTDAPYPGSLLRPRGGRLGRSGCLPVEVMVSLAEQLTEYDDSLVVLGGFGDPLTHPEVAEMLRVLRPEGSGSGVFGLSVSTSAADVPDKLAEALVRAGVDILSVGLDAWTPECYARMQALNAGVAGHREADGDLARVLENLERVNAVRGRYGLTAPIVVPEMIKARDNVQELDAFYDGWVRRGGTVQITGYSHRSGQMEDRAVMNMAPVSREPCRRIVSRCVVLCDGRVAMCDQDFRGLYTIGSVTEEPLSAVWHGAAARRLRQMHDSGRFDEHSLCAACTEWHRP